MRDTISQRNLARELDVSEDALQWLAQSSRLPFSVSTTDGLTIYAQDLPAWHAAAGRKVRISR